MSTDGRMTAAMAMIAAMILAAPAYAQTSPRHVRAPAPALNPFTSLFFGKNETVGRPLQRRATGARSRLRAPTNMAVSKRKPAAAMPPAVAVQLPAAGMSPASTLPEPAAAPSGRPAPSAAARFQAEWEPVSRPESALTLDSGARSDAKPVSTPDQVRGRLFVERAPVAPLAPVLLTPPAELARIVKQSALPDPTSGVVWIVSPKEVNHIDLQAEPVVFVTNASEGNIWSMPWFQRLLATLGGAFAAASAFRMFFA